MPAKILIVDDEKGNLDLLREALRDEAYRLLFARDGKTALKQTEKHGDLDLILLDIMMPEMDGYEVCRHLKANPKTNKIPIIFVTAKVEVEDETKGLALGAADYITKPVSRPIVLARVKTQLALREAQAEQRIRDQRRSEELTMAQQTQSRIYPTEHTLQGIEEFGFRVFVFHQSAREISGDLVHLKYFAETGFALTVADCKGHGIPAALMTMATSALLSNMHDAESGPGEAFSALNKGLIGHIPLHEPVVAAQFRYHIKKGLFMCRAAFPYPLFYHKATVSTLEEGNIPLGYIDQAYRQTELILESGDRLLICSDGITEARNPQGEDFGLSKKRLEEAFQQYGDQPLANCGKSLIQAWKTFRQGEKQADDATLVLLERI